MPKNIISFVCQECGYDSPAYMGKCPECGSWNSMREFHETQSSNRKSQSYSSKIENKENNKPEPLSTVQLTSKQRIPTGFVEMDSVLGGGIVLGSATLVAGDPGIGKSTLLLQLCLNLAKSRGPVDSSPRSDGFTHKLVAGTRAGSPVAPPLDVERKILYVSAEESREQVAMRAMRLMSQATGNREQAVDSDVILNDSEGSQSTNKEMLKRVQHDKQIDSSVLPQNDNKKSLENNLLLLSITDTDQIVATIAETKPDFVVIDSIQTVESENAGGLSGSVGQVRYAAQQFIRLAKQNNTPIMLVGHVTKEGMVAGPMVLSHMVDTVLFLEGEKFTKTRILRSLKNRFGPVDEVGVFLMEGEGMEEVKNPEQIFLSSSPKNVPGSVLVIVLEGTRPFLIEIQALAVYSKYPMPKRVASGMDQKRLELLLAVLQKHARLPVETHDIFVNIAGGIKVSDPAVDLGVCLAIYSSLKDKPLERVVCVAEVGLLGELRKVPFIEKRIKEAKKLGFERIITAEGFSTLREVLESYGLTPSTGSGQGKQWKQKDERHFKLEEE